MIRADRGSIVESESGRASYLGPPGRLAVLVWAIALVTLAPQSRWLLACGLAGAVNVLLYPRAWRCVLRWRWLVFGLLVIVPPALWGGEATLTLAGLDISGEGVLAGLRMLARAMVVVIAVNGFAAAVDISEVAWLFERAGMTGLGFSLGIAVNLLPALSRSSQTAWHSLRMRGGLRAEWWRGLRLLLVTIVANALRRGEEIALAAEARAFSPEKVRKVTGQAGKADLPVVLLLISSVLAVFLVR
jgi:energy-coupling factor transporter transmembrane protein EcfT